MADAREIEELQGNLLLGLAETRAKLETRIKERHLLDVDQEGINHAQLTVANMAAIILVDLLPAASRKEFRNRFHALLATELENVRRTDYKSPELKAAYTKELESHVGAFDD